LLEVILLPFFKRKLHLQASTSYINGVVRNA